MAERGGRSQQSESHPVNRRNEHRRVISCEGDRREVLESRIVSYHETDMGVKGKGSSVVPHPHDLN